MSSDLNGLLRLHKKHIPQASEVLSRAFRDDPGTVYYFPQPAKRAKQLYYSFHSPLRHSVNHGEVYATSGNFEGVAVWVPSDMLTMPFWEVILAGGLSMLFKIDIRALRRLKNADSYLAAVHRRLAPFPHWYLALLGVDPRYQGQGYATRLLQPMLSRLDAAKIPCYLETQTEKNVSLYRHFGFKVIEETTVPDTNLFTWIMLRNSGK